MKSATQLHVLLVDDDAEAGKITARMLAQSGLPFELTTVQNANQASAFLNNTHPFTGRVRPDVVLVGLALPGIDAVAVLTEVRQLRALRRGAAAVIVLSHQDNDLSRQAARVLGADAYLMKPTGSDDMESAASEFVEVWGRLAGGNAGVGSAF